MRKRWRQQQHEIRRRHEAWQHDASDLHELEDDPRLKFIDELPATERDGCFCCRTDRPLHKYFVRADDQAFLSRQAVFLCSACASAVHHGAPLHADRLLMRVRRMTAPDSQGDQEVAPPQQSKPGDQLTLFDP